MIKLLEQATEKCVKLVVYPELAFTTFFASLIIKDPNELAKFFEQASPSEAYAFVNSPNIKPLIDRTNELIIDLYFGFGELGDLGFQAFRAPGLVDDALKAQDIDLATDGKSNQGKGDPIIRMLLCNDRRWAEGLRCYGLQDIEPLLEGYNTKAFAPQYEGSPEWQEAEALFHHRLSCQAGSYQNACFSIHSVKAGAEDHGSLIGGSSIVDPNGHIIAEAKTKEDELVYATIDLAKCRKGKSRVFAFDDHRKVEHYSRLLDQTGVQEPSFLN
ncbi:hypothetical protein IL306_009525 [Fusarium sp. DS 682]|nr:hypothetical protein IL306_009525 [Fusarium sp. DS 682]